MFIVFQCSKRPTFKSFINNLQSFFTSNMNRPSFDELPFRKGDPPFSAWSLYGEDDQLGTLNLLTSKVVAEAGKEIKTGVRVGLDLTLDYLKQPSHNRLALKHNIIHKAPRAVHDDEITLNTQVREISVTGNRSVVCSHVHRSLRSGMDSATLGIVSQKNSITDGQ